MQTPVSRRSSRPLTEAQRAVLPLSPIFAACQRRGLPTSSETRERRLYAINCYFNQLDGFDWIESLKDLLASPSAILVLSSAIEAGEVAW